MSLSFRYISRPARRCHRVAFMWAKNAAAATTAVATPYLEIVLSVRASKRSPRMNADAKLQK
jgi:hypothetical protein